MIHVPARVRKIANDAGELAAEWLEFFQLIGRTYGTWTAVPYAAGDFTASGSMTFTVELADLVTFAYTQMGKRVEVAVTIRGASVGGVVSTTLKVAIPGTDDTGAALVAARDVAMPVWVNDNGTKVIGVARVSAGSGVIAVQKVDGSNWTAAANTTGVEGVIAFEVE